MRPWAVLSPRVPTWVSGGRKPGLNLCSRPFEGLPAEGLLHRHPGAPGAYGGGLLEDGVGVEVPRDRDADRSPGERAGRCHPSRPLTRTSRSPPAGPPVPWDGSPAISHEARPRLEEGERLQRKKALFQPLPHSSALQLPLAAVLSLHFIYSEVAQSCPTLCDPMGL